MREINITCNTRFALTTEATGTLSYHGKCPTSRHLLEWVLEAQANKWSQRAPALQLFVLKEEQRRKGEKRKQERTTLGDQALSKACSFIFKGSLYTLSCA